MGLYGFNTRCRFESKGESRRTPSSPEREGQARRGARERGPRLCLGSRQGRRGKPSGAMRMTAIVLGHSEVSGPVV